MQPESGSFRVECDRDRKIFFCEKTAKNEAISTKNDFGLYFQKALGGTVSLFFID